MNKNQQGYRSRKIPSIDNHQTQPNLVLRIKTSQCSTQPNADKKNADKKNADTKKTIVQLKINNQNESETMKRQNSKTFRINRVNYGSSSFLRNVNQNGNKNVNRSINKMMTKVTEKRKYYISEVIEAIQKENSSHKMADDSSIFLDHILMGLYTSKTNKYNSMPKNPHLSLNLPEMKKKKTLIFDLDQTLIHSLLESQAEYYPDQSQIFLDSSSGNIIMISVNLRPHAVQVLKRLENHFNLIAFTAAEQIYADRIISLLDTAAAKSLFSHRLYRHHCYLNSSENKIKDLRIMQNLDLSTVALIDNSPCSYLFQPENAIPIIPFLNDSQDDQLTKLQKFVMENILNAPDVPKVLNSVFGIKQFHKYGVVKDLIKGLWTCQQ